MTIVWASGSSCCVFAQLASGLSWVYRSRPLQYNYRESTFDKCLFFWGFLWSVKPWGFHVIMLQDDEDNRRKVTQGNSARGFLETLVTMIPARRGARHAFLLCTGLLLVHAQVLLALQEEVRLGA
jgi:hypothetical protein